MSYSRPFLIVIIALLIHSIPLTAQVEAQPPKAKIDIDGSAWMGSVRMDDDGIPAKNGAMTVPTYMVINQDGDRLTGILVSFEVFYREYPQPFVEAFTYSLNDGRMKNYLVTFSTVDSRDDEDETLTAIKCRVMNKNVIKATFLRSDGPNFTVRFRRVEENYLSGMYFGKVWQKGMKKPGSYNCLFSFREKNGSFSQGFALMGFWTTDDPVWEFKMRGVIDSENGTIEFSDTTNRVSGTGTLQDGQLQGTFDREGTENYIEASNFTAQNVTRPKISFTPKPKNIQDGETTDIWFKQKNVALCPHITIEPAFEPLEDSSGSPQVYITHYRVAKNRMYVTIHAAEDVFGYFTLTVTNPSGNEGESKRIRIR